MLHLLCHSWILNEDVLSDDFDDDYDYDDDNNDNNNDWWPQQKGLKQRWPQQRQPFFLGFGVIVRTFKEFEWSLVCTIFTKSTPR